MLKKTNEKILNNVLNYEQISYNSVPECNTWITTSTQNVGR